MQLRPLGQFGHAVSGLVRTTHRVARTPHDELVAIGRRCIAYRSGRGVDGDEHRASHVAGDVEGQTVRSVRLQAGEETSAVENRDSGREYTLWCGDRKMSFPVVAGVRGLLKSDAKRTPS